MMTAPERASHRDRMLAAKSGEECKSVRDAHHKAMEARAIEKGNTLSARFNSCERMRSLGFFK